ncbi:MAG: hypothetical protein AAF098_17085 [Pseudomonadota bacterium]
MKKLCFYVPAESLGHVKDAVLAALMEAHPYEEPARDVTEVLAPSTDLKSDDGVSP